jgi:hypothetical protein
VVSRSSAAREQAYVQQVSTRIADGLRERAGALRQQGRAVADLGSPEEVAARMLATLPEASPWRKLGPFYSTKGFARVLGGVSRQAVDERRRRRRIVALRTADGVWAYPAFQLDDRNQVLPGLGEVLHCFDPDVVDEWTVASLLVSPQTALGGASIADSLQRGAPPLATLLELCRTTNGRLASCARDG